MYPITPIKAYTTSDDYAALWALAKESSIICICDYGPHGGKEPSRDIAHTVYFPGNGDMQVSARGTAYIYADNFDEFAEQCRQVHLEWVVP